MSPRRTFSMPRVAALSTGIAVALSSMLAVGQEVEDAPDRQATTLDRIEVTGSRIRQVDIETAQPVFSISREDMEAQGFRSVADILQNITAAGSPAISRTSPLGAGEAAGAFLIDLRNLGAQRTLILVNGKRLGITTNGLQDLSSLPSSMIERIDVLKDGASSIYGSDAMAGVVNIITRSGYDGAEANVYYGQYSQGDGTKQTYDFVMGAVGERGSLTLSAEYAEEDPVWAPDRWFSQISQNSLFTSVGAFGRIHNFEGVSGRNLVLRDGGNPYDIADFVQQDLTPGTGHVTNTNEQMHLFTPLERRSLFATGDYAITDSVTFRTDLLYSDRHSERQVAGYPLQTAVFPQVTMSIDSYYNPAGNWHGYENPTTIGWSRRTWELPRISTSDLTTYRFTGAFEGSFSVGERFWDWDVGAMYNNNKLRQVDSGQLNLINVSQAVGPSFLNETTGRVECGTPDNPIPYGAGPGACIPWNPLLSYGVSGSGSLSDDADLRAFLFPSLHNLGETETHNYFANITGTLFTLPAGDLAIAAGYEYRREMGDFRPDALSQSGNATTLAAGATRGSYSIDELYLELDVPLLAGVAGAEELTVNLSSRYSDFSTFGDTNNSKFALKWKPIESLLVRGTWAEGFRAPTVSNLFGGGSQTFSFFTDPCDTSFGAAAGNARCLQDVPQGFRQLQQGFIPANGPDSQTPVPFFVGSNPFLGPETSRSKTLGLVWSPEFVQGLNLALDWWSIKVDNTLVADSPSAMLSDCYVKGIESRCQNFTRDPVTGMITALNFGLRNAGYMETEGFDFDLSYRLDTDLGRFGVNWGSTYVGKNNLKVDDEETTPESPQVSFAGIFRLRSNLSLSWEKGDFGASWSARYYSATKEPCFFFDSDKNPLPPCSDPEYAAPDTGGTIVPMHRHGSNTFHDVQFRYKAPWNATISAGANNVFGHYGPPMTSQPNSNFDYYGGFDVGRFVYFKYQQRF